MSENSILRMLQDIKEREDILEARLEKLEKETTKEVEWTPIKFLARKLTCSRQSLYKKIVASGRYEPTVDYIKDGKDICVSAPVCKLFEEWYSLEAA